MYVLTNEAMRGYVKIGFTNGTVEGRLKQLDRTNLPLPFECFYAAEVENARAEELWLHSVFADRRVRDGREFFKIDEERVVAALRRVQIKDVTPKDFINVTKEEERELEEAKSVRARFDFSQCEIPVGSVLTFSRDGTKQAKVVENNRIEIDGKVTSLSASAQKLLGYKKPVAGTLYWMFGGESLDERRRRYEQA